jgi:hypothetical protein
MAIGMQEFQEQKIVSYTPFNSGGVLEALGFHPTSEAVVAQLAVIVLAIVTFIVLDRRGRHADVGQASTRA